MAGFRNLLHNSLSCLYFIMLSTEAGKKSCTMKESCLCMFANGTGIDLQAINTTSFYETKDIDLEMNNTKKKVYTYYYHPCSDIMLPFNETGKCAEPLTLARKYTLFTRAPKGNNRDTLAPKGNVSDTLAPKGNDSDTLAPKGNDSETLAPKIQESDSDTYNSEDESCEYLGSTNSSSFSDEGQSLIYENIPSKTVVRLVCLATGQDKLSIHSSNDVDNIVLTFYSTHACMRVLEEREEPAESSLWLIFLIVAACLLLFYLLLGICAKKLLLGATGIEVIPNETFLSKLPDFMKARTPEEIKKWFMQIGMECNKEHPVGPEEMVMLQKHKLPDSENVKCLMACVFRKPMWLSKSGKFDIDEAEKMIEEEYGDDTEKKDKAKKLFDTCRSAPPFCHGSGAAGLRRPHASLSSQMVYSAHHRSFSSSYDSLLLSSRAASPLRAYAVNDFAVSDGEAGCERSYLLTQCLIEHAPKFGFDLKHVQL